MPRGRAHKIDSASWEEIEGTFRRSYRDERQPLRKAIQIVEKKHPGFQATERQYKRKIRQWKLEKNLKREDFMPHSIEIAIDSSQDTIGICPGKEHAANNRKLKRWRKALEEERRASDKADIGLPILDTNEHAVRDENDSDPKVSNREEHGRRKENNSDLIVSTVKRHRAGEKDNSDVITSGQDEYRARDEAGRNIFTIDLRKCPCLNHYICYGEWPFATLITLASFFMRTRRFDRYVKGQVKMTHEYPAGVKLIRVKTEGTPHPHSTSLPILSEWIRDLMRVTQTSVRRALLSLFYLRRHLNRVVNVSNSFDFDNIVFVGALKMVLRRDGFEDKSYALASFLNSHSIYVERQVEAIRLAIADLPAITIVEWSDWLHEFDKFTAQVLALSRSQATVAPWNPPRPRLS